MTPTRLSVPPTYLASLTEVQGIGVVVFVEGFLVGKGPFAAYSIAHVQ